MGTRRYRYSTPSEIYKIIQKWENTTDKLTIKELESVMYVTKDWYSDRNSMRYNGAVFNGEY